MPQGLQNTPDAESRFHTIFEAAGVAIAVLDEDGVLVECNPAMLAMFGYSLEELRGMTFREITHPDDVSADQQKFDDLIAGRCSRYSMEKRYLRRDGQVIWGVLTVSIVPEASGDPRYVIGIVEDITERKRAEEALRESREHLEASVQASNTGLWDWNLQTNEVYYSTEWKSQLGHQDHEISNRLEEWLNRLHPDDRQHAMATVLAFVRDPGPNLEMEFRLRHHDGSYRWILSRASVLRGPDGLSCRLLGAHLDITDRKQTEERLREYEKVVEGLQEMIVVVDRDYRYLIANRAFLHYRDLEAGQVVGHLVSEILDNDIFLRLSKAQLDECFEGRVVKYDVKIAFPKVGERQLSVSYLPIEGVHGVDRAACVLEDVTDKKRAEEQLREAYKQLTAELQERTRAEQTVRALSDRLITAQEEERGNIARELHDDLSQEIAAINISVSNLKHQIPGEDRALRQQSAGIQERIARMAQRVRHMARRLHPAVLEYSGIASALQSYGAEFSAVNQIEIMVEASGEFEDVPAPIGLCLYRVTQEALQNVAKHSQATTATVRIERLPDLVSLVIQDRGKGFQPLESAGPDESQSGDESAAGEGQARGIASRGLGLVSMSERVRLVNGTLKIESAPGTGTTVSVSIPC
jgi:PAS domain S-box-containing protein